MFSSSSTTSTRAASEPGASGITRHDRPETLEFPENRLAGSRRGCRHPRTRQTRDLGQGLDVVWAVVAAAIDEERRRGGNPTEVRVVDVAGDPRRNPVIPQVVREPVGVETELIGVANEVAWP